METWIIYRMNPYGSPKIETREVQAYDIIGAINLCGYIPTEVICAKLKVVEQVIAGV